MTKEVKILRDVLDELKGYHDNSMISQYAIAETIERALKQADKVIN